MGFCQSLVDLDNLIRLSEIYDVSLDDLVKEDISLDNHDGETPQYLRYGHEEKGTAIVMMLVFCIWWSRFSMGNFYRCIFNDINWSFSWISN